MDIMQLRYFKAVAEVQNMTRASREMHVSQPFMSQTIKALENELETPLFERKGKYIYLNEDGKVFLGYVSKILQVLESAHNDLADRHHIASKSIDMAYQVPLGCGPDLIAAFMRENPDIKLLSHYCHMSRIHAVPYDVLIFVEEDTVENNHTVHLGTDEFVMAMPPGHPQAKRETVDLREFRSDNFIGMPAASPVRRITDEMCLRSGFEPKVVMEDDVSMYNLKCVEAGIGVAVVPYITWTYRLNTNVVYRRISNVRRKRHIYLAWKEHSYLSGSHRKFIAFIQAYFREVQREVDAKTIL